MTKYLFLVLLFNGMLLCTAQDIDCKLSFNFRYGENGIVKGNKIILDNEQWVTFTKFKLYVGNPVCFENGRVINTHQNRYDLLDFSDSTTLLIEYSLPYSTDSLCFSIGTDSLTNVSGLYDGALDPLNGMYWAWNSGYINLKIEGSSSLVMNEDQKFEFHIGGYLPPNTTSRQLCFTKYLNNVTLNFDVSKVVDSHLLQNTPSITIPGKNASSFVDAFNRSYVQVEP
jgi:hypothetical protein